MRIYYLLLFYFIFIYSLKKIKIPLNRNTIIYLYAIPIFLIIALRDFSVGTDTFMYQIMFERSIFNLKHYGTEMLSLRKEPLFWLTAAIIQFVVGSDRVYFAIMALIMIFSLSIFIIRHSKFPMISFWLYVTLGYLGLSMSGLRQMLAISITFLGFKYLINGNWVKYIITILIAVMFHFSAIVMIPIYYLRKIHLNKKGKIGILFVSVILGFLVKDIILRLIFSFNVMSRYSVYESSVGNVQTNPLVVVVALGISTVSLILYQRNAGNLEDKFKNSFDILFIMSCLNIITLIISLDLAIVSRVGYYFSICNIILLPNAIATIRDKWVRLLMISGALMISLSQFLISTPGDFLRIDNYKFFW
ncbi:EpsG family protein [Desulfonispora thiosulfatigenes DSM 11270]|uniref:EpsG family protein n=1 Tax=Desulfonispora thiosulfatigenes DSM 11270 TaxID=656914 RepID=A0A1W1V5S1_DESTI|nr:EpsG family protein [Desulfonispora thiosulfatigenes]SMB88653.1 EpsG family protein [Desulfonispora thiosulfatigenes DSM 11270]